MMKYIVAEVIDIMSGYQILIIVIRSIFVLMIISDLNNLKRI